MEDEKILKPEEMPVKDAVIENAAPLPVEDGSKETPPEKDAKVKLSELLELGEGEDLYEKAYANVSSSKSYREKNESLNQRLLEVFEANDDVASFMREVLNDVPVNVAIARNFDTGEMEAQEGDPDYEEWGKASSERKQKLLDKKAYLKEVKENSELTRKEVTAFAKENNLSEEEANSFLGDVDVLIGDAIKGKVTKDTLGRFLKGTKYEKDLSHATEVAEVAGRNAKIEVMKKKKAEKKGDGIPNLTGQNKVKEPPPKKSMDNFSRAIEAQIKKENSQK